MLATDPIDFLLDDDGDLVIPLQFSRGLPAVAQGIRCRVLLFRDEWFLDLDAGVPYYQDLLGQRFNAARARSIFRDAILSAPGVLELLSLEVSFDAGARLLSVRWKVSTVFGDTADEIGFGG